MKKQTRFFLYTITLLIMNFVCGACSKEDDDNNKQYITAEFISGCFWDECDANGNLRNDQTEKEVVHLFFYSYGEGTQHTYNTGVLTAVLFSWKLNGDMLTITKNSELTR